jgi:hypothetical protein
LDTACAEEPTTRIAIYHSPYDAGSTVVLYETVC